MASPIRVCTRCGRVVPRGASSCFYCGNTKYREVVEVLPVKKVKEPELEAKKHVPRFYFGNKR
jgi:predicted  nucleic acid-binding Zn-ribbon protein